MVVVSSVCLLELSTDREAPSRAARQPEASLYLLAPGSSARSDLPCRIDHRVAKIRQEPPIVEVPPRVEVVPMVGGDGSPSTAQHPAAPENEADEVPPRVEVLRRAGAGEDTVRDRWECEGE